MSNTFYQAWLDLAMVYSCAYLKHGDETLDQEQIKKMDHILTKLQQRPGQRLVDIRLQDYREVTGQFDRISSVGMFEHVGLMHLSDYFQIIHRLLTDEGWVLNHGITSTDGRNGETPLGGGRFIDRYVFPQGELPHLSTLLHAMHQGQLEAVDIEGLCPHYARTTRMWSQNFEAAEHRLRQLVDDKRWRIWRVYLAGCQWAFEHDEISIYQVLCRKAKLSTMGQPWSRGWMYRPAG